MPAVFPYDPMLDEASLWHCPSGVAGSKVADINFLEESAGVAGSKVADCMLLEEPAAIKQVELMGGEKTHACGTDPVHSLLVSTFPDSVTSFNPELSNCHTTVTQEHSQPVTQSPNLLGLVVTSPCSSELANNIDPVDNTTSHTQPQPDQTLTRNRFDDNGVLLEPMDVFLESISCALPQPILPLEHLSEGKHETLPTTSTANHTNGTLSHKIGSCSVQRKSTRLAGKEKDRKRKRRHGRGSRTVS